MTDIIDRAANAFERGDVSATIAMMGERTDVLPATVIRRITAPRTGTPEV